MIFTRWWFAWAAGAALVTLVFGCSGESAEDQKPVVGVGECGLYEGVDVAKTVATLKAGQTLEVIRESAHWLQVKTPAGEEGWLRRCCVCSAAELERRKAADLLPDRIICVGMKEGRSFVYGGGISIRNNKLYFGPGQGVWADESTKGQTVRIAGESFEGDPMSLAVIAKGGGVRKRPVWRGEWKGE